MIKEFMKIKMYWKKFRRIWGLSKFVKFVQKITQETKPVGTI
jgi:hypothetical protein